jgi:hypothetical protein
VQIWICSICTLDNNRRSFPDPWVESIRILLSQHVQSDQVKYRPDS